MKNPHPIYTLRMARMAVFILLVSLAPSWVVGAAEASIVPAVRRPFHVVLDPGHGGSDQGTSYSDGRYAISEKDATLLLARQLAVELRARGIRVTLTREQDTDVSLGSRTAIANRLRADIFLSIHMNSSEEASPSAQGIETFILNSTTDDTSRRLARLENSVLDKRALETPEQTDVALILRDLQLDANLSESKRLACAIQNSVVKQPSQRELRDRGVKQALFHVLLGAEMPSVLVEAGFLSHANDRAAVTTYWGRRNMAQVMARAIDQFRLHRDRPEAIAAVSRCQIR